MIQFKPIKLVRFNFIFGSILAKPTKLDLY